MSAKSEPDTIVVHNAYWSNSLIEEQLEILSRKNGSKGIKIVLSENGKLSTVELKNTGTLT